MPNRTQILECEPPPGAGAAAAGTEGAARPLQAKGREAGLMARADGDHWWHDGPAAGKGAEIVCSD